jgi:hypothetical protein
VVSVDDQAAVRSPRRKRWARFSLRTFLVAVTLIAVGLGWFFSSVENERRAAEAIRAAGGTIVYDWQIRPPDAEPDFKPQPPGPEWLRNRIGPHWFDSIVEVRLNGFGNARARKQFSTVGRQLAELRSLRELSIWGQDLKPDEFRTLGGMKRVEVLRLRLDYEIREDDARTLAGASRLREISISGARIRAAALRQLAGLPRLETLTIDCDSYSPQTARRLTEWQLRDDAAAAVGDIVQLRKLQLFATEITDAGLADLCRLSQLESLTVGSPHITSASFDRIAKLSRLERLGTWAWRIDDADLAKLADLPKLRSLDLLTELSNASVPLVTALPLPQMRSLRLRGECISDTSLPHFHRLSHLERLDLGDTSVDKLGPAAAELKQVLPNCMIRLPRTKVEIARDQAYNNWKWGGGTVNLPVAK